MSGPFTITPDAWYDEHLLAKGLGLKYGSLERARKSGELRFTRRGGRVLYRGGWLLEWLAGEPAAEVASCT